EYAKGWSMGEATPEELTAMCRLTAEAMEDGAFGVATALIYPPNSYSTDTELVEIARVVARYGGVYITHMRSEGDRLLESLADTIALGRQTGVAVEVYHLKATGQRNWSKMPEAIAMIDAARAEGVDVGANMYPYVASGTGLGAILPDWAAAEGKLEERLHDPEMRRRIREEVLAPGNRVQLAGGPEGVLVVGLQHPEHQPYVGKTLAEIATLRGQDWVDTVFDLVCAEGPWVHTMYFLMSEENLRLQMRQPWIKFGTDAPGLDPAHPHLLLTHHPRAYGTYPRILGKYVREEGVLTWEEAIRKMTSAVANRLHIRDRGLLREGYYADVVLFDPDTVEDRATFSHPHQLSSGIREVWVNGQRVLAHGQHTGALPGRPVYGPGR
ncbi:MAG: D-aminoacylase, partial [Nitrospinota bacterium]